MASDLKARDVELEAAQFDSALRLNIIAGFFGMFWIAVLSAGFPGSKRSAGDSELGDCIEVPSYT
jgi:hypothetical protein